jgi:hypothetical protein
MIRRANETTATAFMHSILSELWQPYGVCALEVRTIEICDLKSAVHLAREERVIAASHLLEEYRKAKIIPFSPIENWVEGSYRLIAGPIAEIHDGYPVLVDGLHRCIAAERHGVEFVRLLVVISIQGSLPPPAGETCSLGEVVSTETHRSAQAMYRGLNEDLFRPVGNAEGIDSMIGDRWPRQ